MRDEEHRAMIEELFLEKLQEAVLELELLQNDSKETKLILSDGTEIYTLEGDLKWTKN